MNSRTHHIDAPSNPHSGAFSTRFRTNSGPNFAGSVARPFRSSAKASSTINGGPFNLQAPFGGYRQSGHGRELGRYGIEEFLEYKAMQFRALSTPS